MNRTDDFAVVIIGAGPAGMAAALHLLRRRPALAGRIAAIDKARHPRVKVCAGGLIPKTIAAMRELGVALETPAVEVFAGRASAPGREIELERDRQPLCTIVRRDRFDAALARAAVEAGLILIEETRVLGARENCDRVEIHTDAGAFQSPIVVGADGSGSRVRRDCFGAAKSNLGRALMVDRPVDACATAEFAEQLYRFDFNCLEAGIRGYSWSFPCLIEGRAHLNLGIYQQTPAQDSWTRPTTAAMIAQLARAFPEIDLSASTNSFKGFPIRWHDPADRFATDRVLLAGDAAGVDPLMGEGISFAFEHGRMAAEAIVRHLDGDAAAFEFYDRQMREGVVGRKLRRLGFAARRLYGPHHRLHFRLVARSRAAAQIGIDWYNGARGMDELSIAGALRKWIGAVMLGRPARRVRPG